LQNDGRCSFTEIGAAVHLSANAVADRVRKLTQAGVIRGVRAVVDPAALGLTIEAQIDVKLRPTTTANAFESAIRGLPQVLTASLLTGSFDFSLSVVCTDRADLAAVTEFIRDKAGAQGPTAGSCCARSGSASWRRAKLSAESRPAPTASSPAHARARLQRFEHGHRRRVPADDRALCRDHRQRRGLERGK
jgi:Lrp/AsnC family leucine-responsive transcriptional regulator